MKKTKSLYHGHRFPAAIISCAVRWDFRFQLSLRNIEGLPFERGVTVSYEKVRRRCDKFGAGFAHRVKSARRKPGSTWHLDEVFVTSCGEPYLLLRAVDQHGAETRYPVTEASRQGCSQAVLQARARLVSRGTAQDCDRPTA